MLHVAKLVARRRLHVARFASHVTRCALHAARFTLHRARCSLHVDRRTLHVARCTLYFARCALHVAHCMLHVALSTCTLHDARRTSRCFQPTLSATWGWHRVWEASAASPPPSLTSSQRDASEVQLRPTAVAASLPSFRPSLASSFRHGCARVRDTRRLYIH